MNYKEIRKRIYDLESVETQLRFSISVDAGLVYTGEAERASGKEATKEVINELESLYDLRIKLYQDLIEASYGEGNQGNIDEKKK